MQLDKVNWWQTFRKREAISRQTEVYEGVKPEKKGGYLFVALRYDLLPSRRKYETRDKARQRSTDI